MTLPSVFHTATNLCELGIDLFLHLRHLTSELYSQRINSTEEITDYFHSNVMTAHLISYHQMMA